MPTPNSPDSETVDIHTEPAFREEFGTNVGQMILEKADVSDLVDAPTGRTCNVGHAEQQIRVIGGAALLGVAAFAPLGRNWRIAIAAFGVAEIVTGAMRYCPLWQALGIDTNRIRPR